MDGTLMPDGIAAAFLSKYSFLLSAAFAMYRSEACTNFELHAFCFLLGATPGACDHSGFAADCFFGAISFLWIRPAAFFLGEFSLPSDGGS